MQNKILLIGSLMALLIVAGCTEVQTPTPDTIRLDLVLENQTNEEIELKTIPKDRFPVYPIFEETITANTTKEIEVHALKNVNYVVFENNSKRQIDFTENNTHGDKIKIIFSEETFVVETLSKGTGKLTEEELNRLASIVGVPQAILEQRESIGNGNVQFCSNGNEHSFVLGTTKFDESGLGLEQAFYFDEHGNSLGSEISDPLSRDVIESPIPENSQCIQINNLPNIQPNYDVEFSTTKNIFEQEEEIKILIKNNSNKTMYLRSSDYCRNYFSHITDAQGNFLSIRAPIQTADCRFPNYESVEAGQEKVVTVWSQSTYDELGNHAFVNEGKYVVVFPRVWFGDIPIPPSEDKFLIGNVISDYLFALDKNEFTKFEVDVTIGKYTSTPPSETGNMQPFADAGCTLNEVESGYISMNCETANFVSEFTCSFPDRMTAIDGPAYEKPLLECRTSGTDYNDVFNRDVQDEYFYCEGGLLFSCVSYIGEKDNILVQAKNSRELVEILGLVDTTNKAGAIVLLSKQGSLIVETDDQVFGEDTPIEESGENFVVTLYKRSPIFGCYDEQDVIKTTYKVTPLGSITEEGREAIYTIQIEHAICVD